MGKLFGAWGLYLGVVMGTYAQVDTSYIYNTSTPYGTLDLRIAKSSTRYYYLQEGITFSYRESSPGVKTNTYLPMNGWNTSAYEEGNLREVIGDTERFVMNYRLLKPEGYDADYDPGYPIIIMLHGAGESANCWINERCYWGSAGYNPITNSPPAPTDENHKLLNNDRNLLHGGRQHLSAVNRAGTRLPDDPNLPDRSFPGFVLFPQSLNGWNWAATVEDAIRILRLVIKNYNIDENRVYIHGLSNGGGGVYQALKRAPWLFAAALTMSAVTDHGLFSQGYAEEVGKIPLWTFQGGLDTAPTPSQTYHYVRGFQEAGGNVRYYLYENLGHGTWNTAYGEPDFFSWMLEKSKANPNVYYQNPFICRTTGTGVKMGFAKGFFAYQWERDGEILSDATGPEYTAQVAGTYRARFSRIPNPGPQDWEPWSDPIVVGERVPEPPQINFLSTAHLRGPGLPASDEHNTLRLRAAEEADFYEWFKDGIPIDFPGTDVEDTLRTVSFTHGTATANGNWSVMTVNANCPSPLAEPISVFFDNSAPQNITLTVDGIDLKATPGMSSILLTWSDVSGQEDGYELWRRRAGDDAFTFVTRTARNAVSYLDTALAAGTTYEYKLRAVSNTGRSNYVPGDDLTQNYQFTTLGDAKKPLPPQNVSVVSNTLNSITLSWDAAEDNNGIREYRVHYGDQVVATGSSATEFNLTDLPQNTAFPITVVAVDHAGQHSEPSNQITGTTYVTGLTYKHSTGAWESLTEESIMATWENPEFTGTVSNFTLQPRTQDDYFNFEFSGYLYIEAEGTYQFGITSDDGSRLFLDNELIADNDGLHGTRTVYSEPMFLTAGPHPIMVRYFDDISGHNLTVRYRGPGIEDGTNYVTIPSSALRSGTYAPPPPPAAPSGLSAAAQGMSQVRLTWTYSAPDATAIEVYRATAGGGPYKMVIRTEGTEAIDSVALQAGQRYWYRVRAVNDHGSSDYSAVVSTTLDADEEPPSAPQGVTVISQSLTHIALQWEPATDNTAVTGYEIYSGDEHIGTSDVTAFTVDNLAPETSYTFTIRAIDASDNLSQPSAPLEVTTRPSSIFYSRASGSLLDLATWTRNDDGTGDVPENFTNNGQYFVITNRTAATLDAGWTVDGNGSRIIISEGVTLTVNQALQGNLELQDNATLVLNLDTGPAPNFVKIAESATVNFAGTGMIPVARYGHVVLSGSGEKSFSAGEIIIRGNLTIGAGIPFRGATQNASRIQLAGSLTIAEGVEIVPDHAVDLTLTNVNHSLQVAGPLHLFRLATVEGADVAMPAGTDEKVTLHLGTPRGGGLVLANGSVLRLNHHDLFLAGAASINAQEQSGAVAIAGGSIRFSTTAAQHSFLHVDATDNRAARLEVDATGGAVLHVRSPLVISDAIKIRNGVLAPEGNVLLLSDENGSAVIEHIENAGRIDGALTVAQYLPGRGAITRYLSAPVAGVTVADWQETFPVTGNFAGASPGEPVPSLFRFNNGWQAYPPEGGTSTAPVEGGVGYAAHMPDDLTARTLAVAGIPFQGEVSFPLVGGDDTPAWKGWNLLGNPYASPIRWTDEETAWGWTGVSTVMAVRKDTIIDGQRRSRVRYYDASLGSGIVQPGQAFWVRTYTEEPVLKIQEGAKTSAAQVPPSEIPDHVVFTLRQGDVNDEAYIVFQDAATDGFDAEWDGRKLPNTAWPNFSTLADTVALAVNHVSATYCTKTIAVRLDDLSPGPWSLSMRAEMSSAVEQVIVRDHYADTEWPLQSGSYSFIVDDNPASSGDARLEIVFVRRELNLAGPSVAATSFCASGPAMLLMNNSQEGVVYEVLDSEGNVISTPVAGNGDALELPLERARLAPGENTLQIRAGFPGCDQQVFPAEVTVHLVEELTVETETDLSICEGADVTLEAAGTPPGGFYKWYDSDGTLLEGQTGASLFVQAVSTERVFYVASALPAGCESEWAQIHIYADTLDMPVVYLEEDTLFTDVVGWYQWTLNGDEIPDATLHYYIPQEDGLYSVVARNGGCVKESEPFQVGDPITGIDPDAVFGLDVYPVPNEGDRMHIRLRTPDTDPVRLEIIDVMGRLHYSEVVEASYLVRGVEIKPYAPLFEGVYFIRTTQNDRRQRIRFVVKP